jgi:quinoprotein dehydrogenase-associated probable ABC transporter substrate-binding protein
MSAALLSFGRHVLSAALLIFAPLCSHALADTAVPNPAAEAAAKGVYADKDFDDMSQAEKDAAKQAARKAHFQYLRVCADPGNMPLSDTASEGYENKIAEVLAKSMDAKLSYFWRPSIERGITRQTFDVNECDLLMDVPSDYEGVLETMPLYRTTYVFATRASDNLTFKGLNDPRLKELKIGVFELSSLRQALSEYGVIRNVEVHEVAHDADLVPEHQPWTQVQEVVDGKLDVAGVWGPFAGWLNTMKGEHLAIQPTNLMDDKIQMEFSLAIGVARNNSVLKYALEYAMKAHRAEISDILAKYGVPLVQCSDCLIEGNLPSHGGYTVPAPAAQSYSKPTHWSVSQKTLDEWLAGGADVNEEFSDAVGANDVDRVAYLIGKGADVNKFDNQGTPPLATAARFGCIEMMQLLIAHGANIDEPDIDGWTPFQRAIAANQVSSMKFLLDHGAKRDTPVPGGYTPLSIALEEHLYDAAAELIEAGADVNAPSSSYRLTPLMIVASQLPAESRVVSLLQTHGPIDIARALLGRKANVDATDAEGVTALMIAAARDNSAMLGLLLQSGANPTMKSNDGETARDIAVKNDSLSAIRTLALLVH